MRRLGPLTALLALALVAPAGAQTTAATATIAGSGTSYTLTVLNTGQTQIQCLRFEPPQGVQVTAADGPGTVTRDPLGFSAQGLAIGPDQRVDFTFTTSAPYPENAGGTLFVSPDCQAGSDVRGTVTGPAPTPVPVKGETVVTQVIDGVVLVRRRGSRRFVRLSGVTAIPDGSQIDTTRGRMRLTVDAGNGATQSAEVSEGRAIVDQNKAARPTTTLRLSEPLACPRRGTASAAAKRKKRRRLFLRTKGGRFRTQGRFGAAVASGTAWRTTDACDFTLVQVTEGIVTVRSLRTGATRRVAAPKRVFVVRRRP